MFEVCGQIVILLVLIVVPIVNPYQRKPDIDR